MQVCVRVCVFVFLSAHCVHLHFSLPEKDDTYLIHERGNDKGLCGLREGKRAQSSPASAGRKVTLQVLF